MRNLLLVVGVLLLLVQPFVNADSGGYGMGQQKGMGMESPGGMGKDNGGMMAAPASVVITTPADHATLTHNQRVTVTFHANPGTEGDHVHIYLDGKRVAVLLQLDGVYDLGPLPSGKHEIGVQLSTADHQELGIGKTVTVDVK